MVFSYSLIWCAVQPRPLETVASEFSHEEAPSVRSPLAPGVVSGAGPAVILPLSCRLHDFQNGGSLRVVTSREMDPIRFDPRNHVPEVAPDDLWDDAHGFDSAPGAPVAMLPRKKTQVLPAPVTVADDGGLGLRIQAKRRTRLSEEEEACQLEVRKIDGNVTRLDPETPTVLRVPRQIVFQEAPVGNRLTPPRRDVSKDWGKTGKPSVLP